MILLAAAMLLVPQEVPAAAAATDEVEEVVINAVYGRTTMLFDRDVDGTLKNCRIMVSSGSNKRDAAACQATPVCFAGTATEVTDCVPLGAVGPVVIPTGTARATPPVFEMPRLSQPRTAADPAAIGPNLNPDESAETERQRVKLPPLPKAPADRPVITFGTGAKDE